jgi:hypothetical protein
MLPAEVNILRKIDTDKSWPRKLEFLYDVPGEYMGYMVDSFIKRGMVKRGWTGNYRLTAIGRSLIAA